ncbi:hypothetical protein [Photobacterium damselae]|uniref:hypothetical protein n=1 Tax=Photobacterium damselae TaxID=38293 RepID=UPI001F475645|nr:hypothetical protein [Photobacterium damselae]UKA11850.1 hypothetical protein IHC91_18900 [Photobacterium damselae subsp. damselae]
MMNKNILLSLVLSIVSISSFASTHGMAEKICNVKGGKYIQFSSKSINVDYIKADNVLEHYMTITAPSPVVSGIVYLENDSKIFKQTVIDAVNHEKSLSLCLTSNGDILAATVNGSNL